jgi:hypothetical protein
MDVRTIAEILGCPVAERNATDSWDYDGKTIASYCTPNKYDLFCEEDGLDRNKTIRLSPHDIFHEICHWLVADECQRDLPEYGLLIGVTDTQAFGPPGGAQSFRKVNGTLHDSAYTYNGVVDRCDQDAQEAACWILEIKLGRKFGIACAFAVTPGFSSWEEYIATKRDHFSHLSQAERNKARVLALKGIRELRAKFKTLDNNLSRDRHYSLRNTHSQV